MKRITFWGKVKKGKSRGKDLGFPTANITLHKDIPEGIYISKTKINAVWWLSLTFIGAAKTFHETAVSAEVYILDYNRRIYGIWITNLLLKKIRANKKFKTAKELIIQMKKDEKTAREFLS